MAHSELNASRARRTKPADRGAAANNNAIPWFLRTVVPGRDIPSATAIGTRLCIPPAEVTLPAWNAEFGMLDTFRLPGDKGTSRRCNCCYASIHMHPVQKQEGDQEALGRLRSGFSGKIHFRINAKRGKTKWFNAPVQL